MNFNTYNNNYSYLWKKSFSNLYTLYECIMKCLVKTDRLYFKSVGKV